MDLVDVPEVEVVEEARLVRVDPIKLERRWATLEGLMAGITVIHAVQPVAALTGDLPWSDKKWVAVGGTVLYGTAFIGHHYRQRWSLYIPVIGPMVGFTTVMTGFVLSETTDLGIEIRPDAFQVAGAVLQLPAMVISWRLLKDTKNLKAQRAVAVVPTMNGLAISGTW